MSVVFFAFFAAITIFSALAVAWQKNLLYAAFLLLASFLGVACLFLMASAEFLAVTQVLIYVGGVLTLFLFGILITKRRENRFLTSGIKNNKIAIFLSVSIAIGLFYVVESEKILFSTYSEPIAATKIIGIGLLSNYLLPFELAGMLLLVILIGGLSIASFASGKGK